MASEAASDRGLAPLPRGARTLLTMPEFERDGWTLSYALSGPADAPAALLLHDLDGDRRTWHALAADMGGDFRIVAADLRGFGESGQPEVGSPALRDYADDLVALLDALEVERCAVIGAGFGAEVALELATADPERVEMLVLSGASPWPADDDVDDAFGAREQARSEMGRVAGRFGMGRAGAIAAEPLRDREIRAAMRARYRHVAAEGLAAAIAARGASSADGAGLAALAVPALVVVGEDDPLRSAAERLAGTLPVARLVTIAGCGAGAPFVAPRAFEAALGAFFGDVRAGRPIAEETPA